MLGSGNHGTLPSGGVQNILFAGRHEIINLGVNRDNVVMTGVGTMLTVAENRGTIRLSGASEHLVVQYNNGIIEIAGIRNRVTVSTYGRNGRIRRKCLNLSVEEGVFRDENLPIDGPSGVQQPNQAFQVQNAGNGPVTQSKPLSSRPTSPVDQRRSSGRFTCTR